MLATGSPASSASSRPCASASSRDSSASGISGRAAARAATMLSASGSREHDSVSCVAASASALARSPSLPASSSRASVPVSTSSGSSRAPSVAASPGSRARLVTSTRQDGLPGSSGRTWAASRALSRMTSTRLPASTLRYSAACASTLSGICSSVTPNAPRNQRSASAGATGVPDGSKPRRFTYSCPSGNSAADWCAQCTASAVLPAPAVPPMTSTRTASSGEPAACIQARSSASCAVRPAKCATPAGSWRGTTAAAAGFPAAPSPVPVTGALVPRSLPRPLPRVLVTGSPTAPGPPAGSLAIPPAGPEPTA